MNIGPPSNTIEPPLPARTMSRDQQDAQSRKYGNDIFLILELSTGEFGIFTRDRQLVGIVPNNTHLSDDLRVISKMVKSQKPVVEERVDDEDDDQPVDLTRFT